MTSPVVRERVGVGGYALFCSSYLDRIFEEFSFNNSLLTKTGIQYPDSLRVSSSGRSGDGAKEGELATTSLEFEY